MPQAIFGLASIPLILLSWLVFLTYRDGTGPDWFIKFSECRIGTMIILIAGIIMVFSIFFSYSPDAFWK